MCVRVDKAGIDPLAGKVDDVITVHFSDGTTETGDYYYVVGEPISRLGIPGILVEHAFIGADSDFLDTDEDLAEIGRADADGIAEHFGLRLRKTVEEGASSSEAHTVSSYSHPEVSSSPESAPPEEDDISEVRRLEDMIRALPDYPSAKNANQINAVRSAYNSLSQGERGQLSPAMFQRSVSVFSQQKYPSSVCLRLFRFAAAIRVLHFLSSRMLNCYIICGISQKKKRRFFALSAINASFYYDLASAGKYFIGSIRCVPLRNSR